MTVFRLSEDPLPAGGGPEQVPSGPVPIDTIPAHAINPGMKMPYLAPVAALLAIVVSALAMLECYRTQAQTRELLGHAHEAITRFEKLYETQQTNLEGVKSQLQKNWDATVSVDREVLLLRHMAQQELRTQVRAVVEEWWREKEDLNRENEERGGRDGGRHERFVSRNKLTLGVFVDPIDDAQAMELGLGDERGLRVRRVIPRLPAAAAGIAKDDIILQVNGQPTPNEDELTRLIRVHSREGAVWIHVLREGDRQKIKVQFPTERNEE
jgi:hypothetical protein